MNFDELENFLKQFKRKPIPASMRDRILPAAKAAWLAGESQPSTYGWLWALAACIALAVVAVRVEDGFTKQSLAGISVTPRSDTVKEAIEDEYHLDYHVRLAAMSENTGDMNSFRILQKYRIRFVES